MKHETKRRIEKRNTIRGYVDEDFGFEMNKKVPIKIKENTK